MESIIIKNIKKIADSVLPKGASVTLFGSRARGNNRVDSDWDLLILLDYDYLTCSQKGNYAYPFVELGWKLDAEINPIVHTRNEWSQRSYLSLYHNIQNDGITIWH